MTPRTEVTLESFDLDSWEREQRVANRDAATSARMRLAGLRRRQAVRRGDMPCPYAALRDKYLRGQIYLPLDNSWLHIGGLAPYA